MKTKLELKKQTVELLDDQHLYGGQVPPIVDTTYGSSCPSAKCPSKTMCYTEQSCPIPATQTCPVPNTVVEECFVLNTHICGGTSFVKLTDAC